MRESLANMGSFCRLKLSVYRSLGIDLQRNTSTGDFNGAVVRSSQTGTVDVIDMDETADKQSFTKRLWEGM